MSGTNIWTYSAGMLLVVLLCYTARWTISIRDVWNGP